MAESFLVIHTAFLLLLTPPQPQNTKSLFSDVPLFFTHASAALDAHHWYLERRMFSVSLRGQIPLRSAGTAAVSALAKDTAKSVPLSSSWIY